MLRTKKVNNDEFYTRNEEMKTLKKKYQCIRLNYGTINAFSVIVTTQSGKLVQKRIAPPLRFTLLRILSGWD